MPVSPCSLQQIAADLSQLSGWLCISISAFCLSCPSDGGGFVSGAHGGVVGELHLKYTILTLYMTHTTCLGLKTRVSTRLPLSSA